MPSAPDKIPEVERPGFKFAPPVADGLIAGDELVEKSYAEWEKYHAALGQELAKRIRYREE